MLTFEGIFKSVLSRNGNRLLSRCPLIILVNNSLTTEKLFLVHNYLWSNISFIDIVLINWCLALTLSVSYCFAMMLYFLFIFYNWQWAPAILEIVANITGTHLRIDPRQFIRMPLILNGDILLLMLESNFLMLYR